MPAVNNVRKELVEKFKKEVMDKKYKVKSKEIASKMAEGLFTQKSANGRIDLKI